jgi:phage baseplate assembly protein W
MAKYIDIPQNLASNPNLLKDEEVVVQKVRTLLVTEPGEFIDIPTYGTPLKQFLYEGIVENSETLVKMTITNSLLTWMSDDVTINTIEVNSNIDANEIVVKLDIYLKEYNKNVSVVETFNV